MQFPPIAILFGHIAYVDRTLTMDACSQQTTMKNNTGSRAYSFYMNSSNPGRGNGGYGGSPDSNCGKQPRSNKRKNEHLEDFNRKERLRKIRYPVG